MNPIEIPIWAYHKQDNKFRDFVSRAIVYFTGMPYTHTGVTFRGTTYDSTVWKDSKGRTRSGVRVTEGYPEDKPDFIMVPDTPPDDGMMERIAWALHVADVSDRPYNILQIISLMLVWPTRWFWKKIRWAPFSKEYFGEVCSTFVDNIFWDSRWDLLPGDWEGYTVPGQFVTMKGWHREEVK